MDEAPLPQFPRYGPPLKEPSARPGRPTPPGARPVPSEERPTPPGGRPNDREQRLAALRALANQTSQATTQGAAPHGAPSMRAAGSTTAATPAPLARRSRRLLVVALALIVLAALAGVGELILGSRPPAGPSAPAVPTQLSLNVGANGFGCPGGLAWSPDGSRIAVLAMSGAGGNTCGAGAVVGMIFDAHTGRQVGIVEPAKLLRAQGLDAALPQMTWSPDGKSLVFGGVSVAQGGDLAQDGAPVLVSMPIDLGTPTVLHAPREIPASKPSRFAQTFTYPVVWDLQAGKAILQMSDVLPPALSYAWTADGQLVADTPLPAVPTSPFTGSPTTTLGATSFSRWQPGLFTPIYRWISFDSKDPGQTGPDLSQPPLIESYVSYANWWSPDGRYLAMGAVIGALVPPASGQGLPKLHPQACDAAGFLQSGCPTQITPDADLAFATIEQAAEQGTQYKQPDGSSLPNWPTVAVAWRPDGQQLAAILPNDTYPSGATKLTASIYRTGESTPIARLSEDCLGPCRSVPPTAMPALLWSPTGAQLALLDTTRDTVTIWGGGALPK